MYYITKKALEYETQVHTMVLKRAEIGAIYFCIENGHFEICKLLDIHDTDIVRLAKNNGAAFEAEGTCIFYTIPINAPLIDESYVRAFSEYIIARSVYTTYNTTKDTTISANIDNLVYPILNRTITERGVLFLPSDDIIQPNILEAKLISRIHTLTEITQAPTPMTGYILFKYPIIPEYIMLASAFLKDGTYRITKSKITDIILSVGNIHIVYVEGLTFIPNLFLNSTDTFLISGELEVPVQFTQPSLFNAYFESASLSITDSILTPDSLKVNAQPVEETSLMPYITGNKIYSIGIETVTQNTPYILYGYEEETMHRADILGPTYQPPKIVFDLDQNIVKKLVIEIFIDTINLATLKPIQLATSGIINTNISVSWDVETTSNSIKYKTKRPISTLLNTTLAIGWSV